MLNLVHFVNAVILLFLDEVIAEEGDDEVISSLEMSYDGGESRSPQKLQSITNVDNSQSMIYYFILEIFILLFLQKGLLG